MKELVALLVINSILAVGSDQDDIASRIANRSPSYRTRARRQLGSCSWGQPAVSGCFTRQDGGMYCARAPYVCEPRSDGIGRCCMPRSGVINDVVVDGLTLRCRDGSEPSAACLPGGLCGPGLSCVQPENMCCKTNTPNTNTCPNNGGTPANRCINNWCPNGFFCQNGWCCTGTGPQNQGCPNNALAQGTCDANRVCAQGFICVQGVCCQRNSLRCQDGVKSPIDMCIANQCPPQTPALRCEQPNGWCCEAPSTPNAITCPAGGAPVARCINDWCPPNHFCSQGWCCTGNAPTTQTCPNNAQAQGTCDASRPCANNGFLCIQGVCCQTSAMRCKDGVKAPLFGCIADQCPPQTPALTCEKPNNFCCEQAAPVVTVPNCPNTNNKPTARCINKWCPDKFFCTPEGWCCEGTDPAKTCPNNAQQQSTCSATSPCASADFLCVHSLCCKRTDLRCSDNTKVPVANCIDSQCPTQTPALTCEKATNLCCETAAPVLDAGNPKQYECPGKTQWLGACAGGKNGVCASPSRCNEDAQCCVPEAGKGNRG